MNLTALFDRRPHIVIVRWHGMTGSSEWRQWFDEKMPRWMAEKKAKAAQSTSGTRGLVHPEYRAIAINDWAVMQAHQAQKEIV